MARRIKKLLMYFLIFPLIIFSFNTCNDPVFWGVFQEVEPVPPLIPGSPTKLVVLNDGTKDLVYVASGKILYWYDGDRWVFPFAIFPGRILDIGVGGSDLYVVYELYPGRVFSKFDKTITNIYNNNYIIRNLFSANGELFIGAENFPISTSRYCILHYDGSSFTKLTDTYNNLLNGAAFDGSLYYLSAKDQVYTSGAIYTSDLADTNTLFSGIAFMGIITLLDDTVVAISRNGILYTVDNTTVNQYSRFPDHRHLANGALALWTNGAEHMLLAGRQDYLQKTTTSGYTYGYLELELNDDGSLIDHSTIPEDDQFFFLRLSFREPGSMQPSTVDNSSLFRSTLGKNPVTSILQYPGKDIIFASTQINGVWSYKYRYNRFGWHWNAEN